MQTDLQLLASASSYLDNADSCSRQAGVTTPECWLMCERWNSQMGPLVVLSTGHIRLT